jgi:hypothetical protein
MLQAGMRALHGAEAPLFHGATYVLLALREIKIKVDGVEQECPTHTALRER